jgi:hypothetical protein
MFPHSLLALCCDISEIHVQYKNFPSVSMALKWIPLF